MERTSGITAPTDQRSPTEAASGRPGPLRADGSGELAGRSSAAAAAGEIAHRQFGAIARRQLLAVGIGPTRIRGLRRARRIFSRYPGVYAWGRPDLPEKGQLAAGLLYSGLGSALGGLSALWWRGLLHRRPDLIHIDAPGYAGSRADLAIRHPRRIERSLHDGLPVVELSAALLAASTDLRHDSLRLVLARAEYEGILSLSSLHAAIAAGPPGSRALRAAMAAHLPQLARCSNGFERGFVLLCERFGLEIPEPNLRNGRFVPDMTWERHRLIVELDGKRAHRTAAQRRRDAARQRWFEARGYTVVRFGWAQVQFEPAAVAAKLRPRLRG